MSFAKLALDIGWFDAEGSEHPTHSLDAATVEDAISRAGGRLLAAGHPTDPNQTRMAMSMVRHGIQVLGFLGIESVILHQAGYVRLAFDGRSEAAVERFLRLLHEEQGCGAYFWEDDLCDIHEIFKIFQRLNQSSPQP